MPVRVVVTAGPVADCKQAGELIFDIKARALIADNGYDSNAVEEQAKESGMEERILRTLRAQAWERAKGELNSILHTYWDGPGKDQNYKQMASLVKDLVTTVEDNGLAE